MSCLCACFGINFAIHVSLLIWHNSLKIVPRSEIFVVPCAAATIMSFLDVGGGQVVLYILIKVSITDSAFCFM